MATPQLISADAYDVNVGTIIQFNANNGYQPVKSSKIFILDIEGNLLGSHLYQGENIADAASRHIITKKNGDGWTWTSEELKAKYDNNNQYIIYIVTFSDIWGTQNPSFRSNEIGVWALRTPLLNIIIDDPHPETTSYIASAEYDSTGSLINNAPNSAKFYLYTRLDDEVVDESPIIYTSGIMDNTGKYLLNYTFDNLVNGREYYISVEITSVQGMVVKASSIDTITPSISIPPLNVIQLENDRCNACINIHSQLTNIEGKMADGSNPSEYISPNGMLLTDNELIYDIGLSFTPNWNLSFWGNQFNYANQIYLGSQEYIMHFISMDTSQNPVAYIDVFMLKDKTDVFQKAVMCVYPIGNNGVASYFESNEIFKPNASINEFTCIKLQYKNYLYSIEIENKIITPEP